MNAAIPVLLLQTAHHEQNDSIDIIDALVPLPVYLEPTRMHKRVFWSRRTCWSGDTDSENEVPNCKSTGNLASRSNMRK